MKTTRTKHAAFIFLLACTTISFAQNVKFDAKNFDGQEDAFKEAKKSLSDGDVYFFNGMAYCKYNMEETYCKRSFRYYKQAFITYKESYAFNPNNALLNFKLGICLYNGDNKYEALPYFEKAYQLDPKVDSLALYYLGCSYQIHSQWDQAISCLTTFKKNYFGNTKKKRKHFINATEQEIARMIEECQNGKKSTVVFPAKIANMGKSVNTIDFEYNPLPFENGKIITYTNRKEVVVIQDDIDEMLSDSIITNERIMMSVSSNDTTWTPGKQLNFQLKSKERGQASLLSISVNKQYMLVYKGGDIYESTFKGNSWSTPKLVPGDLNTSKLETSAAYSPNGDIIYFSSDRPGGLGAKDLYQCRLDSTRTCTKAENLGPVINTSYDEDGIFVTRDGRTIFFASKGHNSMGGYDLYLTSMSDTGTWSVPKNMGIPTNSPDDDIFLVFDRGNQHGYLASYRDDTYGNMDIYKCSYTLPVIDDLNIVPNIREGKGGENILETAADKVAYTDVTVKTFNTRDSSSINASVYAARQAGKQDTVWSSKAASSHTLRLVAGSKYKLRVSADGFCSHTFTINVPTNIDNIALTSSLSPVPELLAMYDSTKKRVLDSTEMITMLFGTVKDIFTQKPVVANVTVYKASDTAVVAKMTTDAGGKYLIRLKKGENYKVKTSADGYLFQDHVFSVTENGEAISFNCKGVKTESAVVLSASWSDVEEQKLCVVQGNVQGIDSTYTISFRSTGKTSNTVTASSRGKFRVVVPAGNTYEITISANGYEYVFSNSLMAIPANVKLVTISPQLQKITPTRMEIKTKDINFATNKFVCEASLVDGFYDAIQSVKSGNATVRITGHTDDVGADEANQLLSEKRAKSVQVALSRYDVRGKATFIVKGAGETSPKSDNTTEDGRAANRRTEIRISTSCQ